MYTMSESDLAGQNIITDSVLPSDSASFKVMYTSISSHGDPLAWAADFFGLQEPDSPEAAPTSPDYEDLEEDPEEDDADYFADGGDEEPFRDEEDDEADEHLALADSPAVPVIDHVPSAEDTEAFETDEAAPTPAPSPRRHTARMFARPQTLVPWPSEAEVERLLALPILPPSPLTLLLSSLPQIPLPPLPPVPTSLPLSLSPLQPLPASLCIPSPVNRREDTSEAELPPRKRLCLTALTSRYEVGESSTAAPRPIGGHRVDYGFIGMMDAKTVEEVAPMTLEGVNARVTELAAVQEQDTQDMYAMIKDTQDRQTQIYQRVDILAEDRHFHYETARLLDQEALVSREAWSNMPPKRTSAAARAAVVAERAAAAAAAPMTTAAIEYHNSDTGTRGTVRTPRECTYKDFLNCKSLTFKGTEGVFVLTQWFEKTESVFHISNCAVEKQVKFDTCTFLRNALTWWNYHMKAVT
uniref:Reverse transcriptase domain-containing protein n=1 Tax=Tanacetum cinerariifolium TaxID=118510 RepID=A0A699HTL5_TANCI|nr:hypothetical protein [Tanacetum cinerariifolium]